MAEETVQTTTITEKEKEKKKHTDKHEAIIVDLGKKSRKSISDLRKGRGPLMDDVEDCIDELREHGTISAATQPVIVVVERRIGVPSMFPVLLPPGIPGVLPMGAMRDAEDDDDDHDDED
jgi:hypothetical protein